MWVRGLKHDLKAIHNRYVCTYKEINVNRCVCVFSVFGYLN